MRTGIYGVLALLLFIAAPLTLAAQDVDTVWYTEWYRYNGPYKGDKEYSPSQIRVWQDGFRTMIKMDNDRYVSIIRDSLYTIDTFHTSYTDGPMNLRDLMWFTETGIRHRKTAPPLSIERTGKYEEVKNYDTEEWRVRMVMNKLLKPVYQELLVTDQLPLPDSLLRNFYMAQSFIEAGVFTDWLDLADTLVEAKVIPLETRWHSEIPSETPVWFTTKLVKMELTTVPKDFFLPPPGYTYNPPMLPPDPDEYLWMQRMIPMPGGPRE